MPDPKVKQRLKRAVRSAAGLIGSLPQNYNVMLLENEDFHICAFNNQDMLMIRITLDDISEHDREIVSAYQLPKSCYADIWCKKQKERGFETLSKNRVND